MQYGHQQLESFSNVKMNFMISQSGFIFEGRGFDVYGEYTAGLSILLKSYET